METSSVRRLRAAATLIVCATACRATPRQPAAEPARPAVSPEASRPNAPATTADRARSGHTAADVRFVQGMIGHHAQALAMTSLVPARTTREDMRLLAQRIEVSQKDEIAAMQRWLRDRGETVPDPDPQHVHHMGGSGQPLMPGMLTPDEMAQLAKATGVDFDRSFLRFMIRHHEGALAMVASLFATPGAGQEAQLFDFASDVDADQRAEIARMRALLAKLPNG